MIAEQADIVVVGAGAAGLMASIQAGRTAASSGRSIRIVALDGARTLGAKILVAGGGRCNVTHHAVDESAYAGSSRHAIKQVLRAFDVTKTVAFFRELGVELKREETGKLFPTTDSARAVLGALLDECRRLDVDLRHPWRVERVEAIGADAGGGFIVHETSLSPPSPAAVADVAAPRREPRLIRARRVILATGGKSLPKSGSDGKGYAIAQSLGHRVTERVFPALVPLVLQDGHFIRELSGITFDATLELRSKTGKRLISFTNSTLCTHFGLSGPSVLDISRYYLDAVSQDRGSTLLLCSLPGESFDTVDQALQGLGKRSPLAYVRERLPERLALALCAEAGIDATSPASTLTRDARRAFARALTELPLPVAGDRGYTYAEVTAGGVPLSELHLQTLESRACPGLHLVGELCDVDGRIGGFNFQWAWASGHVAGQAAARGP